MEGNALKSEISFIEINCANKDYLLKKNLGNTFLEACMNNAL